MVPNVALQRVFHLCFGEDGFGTGVVIEHQGHEYLLTARHVCSSAYPKDTADDKGGVFSRTAPDVVHVERHGDWHRYRINKYVEGAGYLDAAVMELDTRLGPTGLLPLPMCPDDGFFLGQQTFALGFPDGNRIEGAVNNGFPIPFIRQGCIAGWQEPNIPTRRLTIDGHVNPGMSGGPVIVARNPRLAPVDAWTDPMLIGIITNIRSWRRKARLTRKGRASLPESFPSLYYSENQGLYDVLDIRTIAGLLTEITARSPT